MPNSAITAKETTPNAYYFLIALLPGILLTTYYSGLTWQSVHLVYYDASGAVKLGIAAAAAIIFELIMITSKRQTIRAAIKNPQTLLISILLVLFLPNNLAWWQISTSMVFAVIVGQYILDNRLHAVLIGYVFTLVIFPTAMGLSTVLKYGLYTVHFLEISAAFLVGGLFLIYKRSVNWKLPLSILIIYIGLMALNTALYSDATLSFALIGDTIKPTILVSAFFIAPFIVDCQQNTKVCLLYGIVIALISFLLGTYGRYPHAMLLVLLLANLTDLAVASRTTPLHHAGITALSSHVLLVPILSASIVMVVASSITQAIIVGAVVALIYLAAQSISDVLQRYIAKTSMPSLIIVLTVFFSTYIGLSFKIFFPPLAQTLDSAIPLLALSSLILSFSYVFTGNTTSFTLDNGLKVSALFFVLVLLIGTISQFTDMNRLCPAAGFLLFALISLCNNKKLSIIVEPENKQNRRVRATGTIK